MDWFPIIAPDAQTPYDPGPYAKPALTPLAPGAASTLTGSQSPLPADERRGQAPRPVRA